MLLACHVEGPQDQTSSIITSNASTPPSYSSHPIYLHTGCGASSLPTTCYCKDPAELLPRSGVGPEVFRLVAADRLTAWSAERLRSCWADRSRVNLPDELALRSPSPRGHQCVSQPCLTTRVSSPRLVFLLSPSFLFPLSAGIPRSVF